MKKLKSVLWSLVAVPMALSGAQALAYFGAPAQQGQTRSEQGQQQVPTGQHEQAPAGQQTTTVTQQGPTGQQGPVVQLQSKEQKVLSKLLKRQLWRQAVLELVRGRVTLCVDQFAEKVQGVLSQSEQSIKQFARQQHLDVSQYKPETQQEQARESSAEQRQQAFAAKVGKMRGIELERVFLRWIIKLADRMETVRVSSSTLSAPALNVISDQAQDFAKLKAQAQQMLGND